MHDGDTDDDDDISNVVDGHANDDHDASGQWRS